MNNVANVKPPGNSQSSTKQNVNPFARALAESEKRTYNSKQPLQDGINPFGEALARTGGQWPKDTTLDTSPQAIQAKQEELERQLKQTELRKKLHDQVNPVEQTDIFSARRERTKKEMEEIRKELKKLATEISHFYKEVDIQTTQQLTDQGEEGTGIKSYFQKLKDFIILLTKKVRSARTWMHQQQVKASKKRKIRGGLVVEGSSTQETKAVFDMMHHERSSSYSGG